MKTQNNVKVHAKSVAPKEYLAETEQNIKQFRFNIPRIIIKCNQFIGQSINKTIGQRSFESILIYLSVQNRTHCTNRRATKTDKNDLFVSDRVSLFTDIKCVELLYYYSRVRWNLDYYMSQIWNLYKITQYDTIEHFKRKLSRFCMFLCLDSLQSRRRPLTFLRFQNLRWW